jgi:dTMP kinase
MSVEFGQHESPMLAIGRVGLVIMERGRLITIEGIDGAGKTTLATSLHAALRARGIDVELLREPGGVQASEHVRELVKDPNVVIGARAEALLYAAARAQLVEQAIEPNLAGGRWVLLDRFVDSSLAYQGAGRDLGIAAVREINQFATGGLAPDRTLLLSIDPALGKARSHTRSEPLDRLEREHADFHARIADAYAQLAVQDPHRIRTIDATQAPGQVLGAALDALSDLI